jgi:medium-chain acyl-[acyl-carrier-protein] hydrolase
MPALIETLVPTTLSASPLFPWLDRPFAFFGASLGGLIAFELVRALSTLHGLSPAALCIASCRAPHLPGPHPLEGTEHFHDAEVFEHVCSLEGTPEYILADSRFLPVILPKHWADALLEATYAYVPDIALDCPIMACGGEQDVLVGLPELVAWQAHTQSTFRLQQFPGDHFFVRDASARDRALLLEQILRMCCKA